MDDEYYLLPEVQRALTLADCVEYVPTVFVFLGPRDILIMTPCHPPPSPPNSV